ncbi:MAG: pilin [Candidatus Moraniibacteriota bacterium]
MPASGSASQSIAFTNPLRFDTVEGVLGSLLGALQGIIVVLALVFIVIGAVLYITSAGNDSRMKLAKGAITAAMIGLAIGIAAPSFLKEISSILGWNAMDSSLAGAKTLSAIALNVLNFLLSLVGVLGIIMLVIGGIMYLTAAGDEDRIDTGKDIVKYAIIGIVVALAALIIVTQIANLFAGGGEGAAAGGAGGGSTSSSAGSACTNFGEQGTCKTSCNTSSEQGGRDSECTQPDGSFLYCCTALPSGGSGSGECSGIATEGIACGANDSGTCRNGTCVPNAACPEGSRCPFFGDSAAGVCSPANICVESPDRYNCLPPQVWTPNVGCGGASAGNECSGIATEGIVCNNDSGVCHNGVCVTN